MGGEVRADTAQYSCKIAGKTFQVLELHAFEEISQLFRFSLTLWLDDPEVAVADMVRKDATVKVKWGGKEREYRGLVASFSQTRAGKPGLGGVTQEFGEYSAEVVPTLALLSHTRNCRIFQKMGADAIVKKVLDGSKMVGKYEWKSSACPEREYCVQYRETDLAFISRLMEEEGLFYYFTHDGTEKMVVGDSAGHYGTCAPDSEVEYKTPSGELSTSDEYLSELTWEESAFPGKVKYKDFNYREPSKPLKVEQTAEKHTDLEVYDYHLERYLDDGRGRSLANVLVKAHEARKKVVSAQGTWRSASSGCKLTLSKAYRGDLNGEYVVVSANHAATQDALGGVDYTVTFEAVPSSVVFRPLPVTPQPALNPQTATVVGPPGEKIYMDSLGRAKVQFHWDLEGSSDEDSSCWIRVAQPFAGMDADTHKKHGFQWHPQIGDEVVVDFLEGDADNPLIVGSVYNATNAPLVKPEELIRQMILTRYQHRLLMDDKNATITMSTGGGETLTMVDKKKEEGRVRINTVGDQSILMEDNHDTSGNVVLIRTSLDHEHLVQLSDKGDRDMILVQTAKGNLAVFSDADHGIKIATEAGHTIKMDDPSKSILIETVGKHTITMDDVKQSIVVKSKAGGRFEINDAGMFLEMSSPTEKQKLRIDYSGTGLKLEAAKGDISFSAPTGKVSIQAQSLDVKTSGDAEVVIGGKLQSTVSGNVTETVGGSMSLTVTSGLTATCTGQVSVNGTTVTLQASSTLSLQGLTSTLQGTATCTVSGALVNSSATAINSITGAIVKIN